MRHPTARARWRLIPIASLAAACLCACDPWSRPGSAASPEGAPDTPALFAAGDSAAAAEGELLRRYGWTVLRGPARDTFRLPDPVDRFRNTEKYLHASQTIGLDFGRHAGRLARTHTYRVAKPGLGSLSGLRAHLLLVDGKIEGAWISAENAAPGIYSMQLGANSRH